MYETDVQPKPMIDIPQELENAVDKFTRRGIGAMAPRLLKGLAIAGEPFFRKNMGQRYLDNGARATGFVLWLAATVLSYGYGGNMTAYFAFQFNQAWLCILLNHPPFVSLAIGLIFVGSFLLLAANDQRNALQRHFDGAPRHSMSRGEPRIKDPQVYELANIGGCLLLFMYIAPLGLLFIVSRCFSALLAAKQEEAILSRYYDAIDSKIEAEQLESSLLGDTPPENTYLYKSLSNSIPGEMRKNIAAAAAGSRVKVVARGPQNPGTPPPASMVAPI